MEARRARLALFAVLVVVLLAPVGSLASPPAAAAAGCGGAQTLRNAGGTWQCTFGDDFDGSSLDGSKWVAQRTDASGYTSGKTACFVDTPGNISVADGALHLTARREAAPFTCHDPSGAFNTLYTSGMVSTHGRFSQTYGRFEVRARISSAKVAGLQTSFWLWPVDSNRYGPWPGSGEIDIAELFSQYADRAIPYIHYNPATPDPNVTSTSCVIGNPDDFHTYAVEWTTSQLKVVYDGRTCLIDTPNPASPMSRPQPFDQPFIIALTQALGIGSNDFNAVATPLPATTTVDYVRAWQLVGSPCPKARTARAGKGRRLSASKARAKKRRQASCSRQRKAKRRASKQRKR